MHRIASPAPEGRRAMERYAVPDGKACVRRRAGRKPCSLLWLLAVAIHGAVSTGCSFIYTKGPQPEVQPPPPCTVSNTYPIADTVLAAASVGAVVAGGIVYANSKNCSGFLCGLGHAIAGGGAIVGGAVGTAAFVPSAITGFNRTADCRAWLQANPQYAPPPPPPAETSSSLLVPARRCPSQGDAPLRCSARASWESSALVLDAPSGGSP